MVVKPGEGTFTLDLATSTVTFTPEAAFSGTSTVSYQVGDAVGTTAVGTITIGVSRPADLSLSKACDPGPVPPGAVVNCSVTVFNAGPEVAQSVAVSDDLPDGVTLLGTPSGGGFTCGTGDPFTCTLPSLAVSSSATFTFSVRISGNASPGVTFTNSATVSSATPDLGPGVNSAVATTSVVVCGITGAGDVLGTPADDVICGSAGADRISGLGGNDVIFGLGGDDQVHGGDGNDTVTGDLGDDRLAGGNGNDTLFGGPGIDRLSGDLGDDVLDTADGFPGDFAVGGAHVGGDACIVGPGDFTAQCEATP